MSNRIKISEIKHLIESRCLTLSIPYNDLILDILVVSYAQDKYKAYLNQCPHTGVNLNWQANQCFDFSEKFLSCSLHGALFQPEDGLCIYGPCVGKSLSPVEIEIVADNIYLKLESINID